MKRSNWVSSAVIQTIETESAILDLHFLKHSSVFAVASSTGSISFFSVRRAQNYGNGGWQIKPLISEIEAHQLFDKETLILSFDWYNPHPPAGPLHDEFSIRIMTVTTSKHESWLVRFSPDLTTFQLLNNGAPITEHGDNVWCCAFTSKRSVFTGGDDSQILLAELTPLPLHPETETTLMPYNYEETNLGKTFLFHKAGVTAIVELPILLEEPLGCILLTGSFDEFVRIHSTNMSRPGESTGPSGIVNPYRLLAALNLGAGVWRLKLMNKYDFVYKPNEQLRCLVLACCISGGTRILEINGSRFGAWSIRVVAAFEDHGSMNYASDVKPLFKNQSDDDMRLCVSTSFYDKKLCVWEWDPKLPLSFVPGLSMNAG